MTMQQQLARLAWRGAQRCLSNPFLQQQQQLQQARSGWQLLPPMLGGVRSIISQPSPSKLNEVMKIEELMGRTPEEISDIWLQYHSDASKNRVGSVMTAEEYLAFRTRAKESPLFVLPLAKPGGGFLTMVSQCQSPFVLLTTLEEYRSKSGSAPPHFTVTIYPELVDSKGVALLRGDVVSETIVNPQEGRLLLEVLRAFYSSDEDYKLVHTFNHDPTKFDFEEVLKKMGHAAAAQAKET